MDGDSRKAWYLVYTKPRQEPTARTHLERQGYEVYLPLARRVRRSAGRQTAQIGALFPRYLFIRLDSTTDNWAPIRSTVGVSSIVRFGHQAGRVPDALIAYLKNEENPDGLHELPPPVVREGDAVRITEGAMSGFSGVFMARTGRERVVVLLKIMGQYSRVTVPADAIEARD